MAADIRTLWWLFSTRSVPSSSARLDLQLRCLFLFASAASSRLSRRWAFWCLSTRLLTLTSWSPSCLARLTRWLSMSARLFSAACILAASCKARWVVRTSSFALTISSPISYAFLFLWIRAMFLLAPAASSLRCQRLVRAFRMARSSKAMAKWRLLSPMLRAILFLHSRKKCLLSAAASSLAFRTSASNCLLRFIQSSTLPSPSSIARFTRIASAMFLLLSALSSLY
mmetsp:Transcript_39133/g.83808  ORF Transcript_39133/g.83808 Transcript_39133/m.83808 type:complete len:227 (-) Transcript_39133:1221-1901(-)